MARSKQTDTAHLRPVWHKKTFRDHAGHSAIRLRFGPASEPIPEDFKQNVVFAFQVYSTVPISTSASATEESAGGSDESSAKRSKGETDVDISMTSDLQSLGDWLGDSLSSAQRPSPVWEIYEPQVDALACVEHQKREIAHRKARHEETDTLLIPMVSKGESGDQRRNGFCIVITSHSFRQDLRFVQGDHSDPEGPLWVWFRRHTTPAAPTEGQPQTVEDRQAARLDEADAASLTKLEIEIERKQKVTDMQHQLTQMYFFSCAPNSTHTGVGGITVGLNQDEDQPSGDPAGSSAADRSTEAITRLAGQLSLDEFQVEQRGDKVVVTSGSGEPALRYVVYVLLSAGDDERLEEMAKAFTQAIVPHLAGKTVSFEFRRPTEPTLSSVLSTNPSLPDGHVGALVNAKRIHPLARRPEARFNNPDTCGIEPYRTFLIFIDKPTDFIEGAGVLCLLTDGGKQPKDETDPQCFYSGPTFDYVETIVWRCDGLQVLAKRLAMEDPGSGASQAVVAEAPQIS